MRHCSFWKHLADYFPVKIIKTAELDSENGNYLLGSHPHGILCSGAFISFATDGAGWSKNFPNLVPNFLMLPAFFQAPGLREIMSLLGKSQRARKVKRIQAKKLVKSSDSISRIFFVYFP